MQVHDAHRILYMIAAITYASKVATHSGDVALIVLTAVYFLLAILPAHDHE